MEANAKNGVKTEAFEAIQLAIHGVETSKESKEKGEHKAVELFMDQLASDTVKRLSVPTGCLVDQKYEVVQYLGSGAYGNVYKVKELSQSRNSMLAMKVIKSNQKKSPSVLREVEMLCYLNTVDPFRSKSLTVKMFRPFTFYRHLCIVYELLGPTVQTILIQNKRRGFPLQHVRQMVYQLCISISFLHQNGIVHHDIKPDNIAFVYGGYEIEVETGLKIMRRVDIKLIDFGSAVFCQRKPMSTATTRQYRAPEMGLKYNWSQACDIWSLGCSVFEIFSGTILLPCASEVDKCYMIQAIFTKGFPLEMGRTSDLGCFDVQGRLRYTSRTDEIAKKVKPFDYNTSPGDIATEMLFDLMKKMLVVVPTERITAADALLHPFVIMKYKIVLPTGLMYQA